VSLLASSLRLFVFVSGRGASSGSALHGREENPLSWVCLCAL
jgi:hypothetical protein